MQVPSRRERAQPFSVSRLHGTPANPEQLPASIQEVNASASSGVTSSSLLSRSAISSQVTVALTRNGTGGVIPLAEAITQISFLEFLQRFGVLIAPPQPPQPPVSNSLLEAAVQTTTPCNVSQDVSTQTSYHSDTLLCDVAVQTSFFGAPTLSLDAAAQTITPSTLSQHVSTQMGSRSASSFSVDASVQILAHSAVLIDAATQLDLTEFLIGWTCSDRPVDRRHPLCQSPPSILGAHVAPLPPPGLEQPAPHPVIATQPQSLTNVSSSHCHTLQPTASTTNVGTHPVRPAGAKRSASTAHAGNHNSFGPCPRTEVTPSPNPLLWSSLCSTLGTPKLAAPVQSPQLTAISCITNFAFPYYSGIQARRAEILPILSPLPVESFMRLFFRKPVIMFRTYLPIFLRSLTTRTLQFCSTRTPLSQTHLLPRLRSTLRVRILGAWCCSLSVLCFVVPLFLAHLQSHFALHISTMLWPRNVTLPPSFSNFFTPKCWSTTSTSLVVTST